MFRELAYIGLVTLIPTLELRASIPYGIFKTDLHWTMIFFIAVITNIVLGAFIYAIIDKTLHHFMKFKWFAQPYNWYHKRVHNKIHKNVEKYGEWGLALFIGVPLPGSGVYSGAIAAHLLGMNFRQFVLSTIIGVLIAGIAVTLISIFGGEAFNFFINV